MAEGVNVRFTGNLQQFIHSKISGSGIYNSASEYIRDLVRKDYEQEQDYKWNCLIAELMPAMRANEADFVDFDIESIIKSAKKKKS